MGKRKVRIPWCRPSGRLTLPRFSFFYEFLAYATGTGGSILIIGSAAGVAAMGMERITFFWFFKRITFLALLGYLAGAFTYIAMF
jgi:Na+/H+ antiporter NhaD/arsenite permease-like protein